MKRLLILILCVLMFIIGYHWPRSTAPCPRIIGITNSSTTLTNVSITINFKP